MKRWWKTILILVLLVGVGAGCIAWYMNRGGEAEDPYRYATVQREDLVVTISATGTVQPEETVDIGAQISGQIKEFGKDVDGKPVSDNSKVKQGMVLAVIDDVVYQANVVEAEAQLKAAVAGVQRAEADLLQLKAKLQQAQRDWERAKKLGPSEALAAASFDAYKSAYDAAQANVTIGVASIEQAKASESQAKALLDRAQRNLSYCTIVSPVDGEIIKRRVNIGQTVTASLNTPSLFLIARDLTKMQLWVAVNEADVGRIKAGQPVGFTVESTSGRNFEGMVHKVLYFPTVTQNVLTYTVEVRTDNSDRVLIPYTTANVRFEVDRRDNVLTVPAAALRWAPPQEKIVADPPQQPQAARGRPGTLWTREGELFRPIHVTVGITDGVLTEVSGADLKEGVQVVTGDMLPQIDAGPANPTNPFAPPRRRGGGGGGGGGRRS